MTYALPQGKATAAPQQFETLELPDRDVVTRFADSVVAMLKADGCSVDACLAARRMIITPPEGAFDAQLPVGAQAMQYIESVAKALANHGYADAFCFRVVAAMSDVHLTLAPSPSAVFEGAKRD